MEVQITDFENAAFAIFIVLLSRTILSFNLNFYMPISKVDYNMSIAHRRGSVLGEKFFFRKNVLSDGEAVCEKMSINEIINGTEDFPGFIPLISQYLNSMNLEVELRCKLLRYLSFVGSRADGTLVTCATWMRSFLQSHQEYQKDSVITEGMNYDLMAAVDEINQGTRQVPELLGSFV